jgi:hypothetical protein
VNHLTKYSDSAERAKKHLEKKGFLNVRIEKKNVGINEGDESEADYQEYLKSLKDKKDKTKSTIKSVRGK